MRRCFLIALVGFGCEFRVGGLSSDDAGGADLGGDLSQQTCDPAGADNRCSDDSSAVLTCRADGSGFDSTSCWCRYAES